MPTRFEGTQDEKSVLDAWIKLARARDTVVNCIRPVIEKHGLTISQFGALECIYHLGPQSQANIGKKLLVSGPNIVKVIDNLERDQMVKRVPHKTDRRSNLVELTGRGKSKIKLVFAQHLEALKSAFDGLSEKEIQALAQLSKKLGLSNN
jgi:MarR family 2-MHQ and catechol resistance regulon transcriptional repressor